jgi:GntR family transcriptional regulator, transcriptional repressor for pyruvate dehydrogenase complex
LPLVAATPTRRENYVLNPDELRPPSSSSKKIAARSLNRNRVADRVARDLAVQLLEAGLPEGTRLPPEQELCNSMACSRTSIRSALRVLESWGLITIQNGRDGGPIVRYPKASDLQDTLSILIYCERATLMDVLVARRAIDPIIAAEAAAHATPEHITRIDAALARMRAATAQRESLDATAELQRVLAEASGLVVLGLFLRLLTTFGEESRLQRIPFNKEWKQHVIHTFERIRDAIAAHDSDAARAEMVLHRRNSEQHWHENGEAFLRIPFGPFEFS